MIELLTDLLIGLLVVAIWDALYRPFRPWLRPKMFGELRLCIHYTN